MRIKSFDTDALLRSKGTHMPICFLIEATDACPAELIKKHLSDMLNELKTKSEFTDTVDVAVVSYSFYVTVPVEFVELKNFKGIDITIEENVEIPAFDEAFEKAVNMTERLKREYKAQSISCYTPTLILFSSGRTGENEIRIKSIMKHQNLIKGLNFVPFTTGRNDELMKELSSNNQVYYIYSADIKGVFDTIGQSMENLSNSSSVAYESLVNAQKGWDNFIKR